VTKRVHRPGYHIQWKKIERVQNSVERESKIKESEHSSARDKITLESSNIAQIETDQTIPSINDETHNIPEPKKISSSHSASIEPTTSEPSSTQLEAEETSYERPVAQHSVPPIFWRTPPENLRKLGIALMLIGGMILFASLLVYFGAFAGGGNGAWLDFFLYLIDISGWFWVLFFIVIFVLVSYLFFLLVLYVLGGPLVGLFVGLGLLALGIFFYTIGKRRTVEP
jgi:hypothetical protein